MYGRCEGRSQSINNQLEFRAFIFDPDGRKPAKYMELVMRYALCSYMQQDERPKSMSLSFVDRIGEGGIGGSGISASCRIT